MLDAATAAGGSALHAGRKLKLNCDWLTFIHFIELLKEFSESIVCYFSSFNFMVCIEEEEEKKNELDRDRYVWFHLFGEKGVETKTFNTIL